MPDAYEKEQAFAERMAVAAGALLLAAFGNVSAREKGPSDLVTEADTNSQALIARMIAAEYPDHTLLAEEDDVRPDPAKSWKWIVDPLDGTINFAHGFPFWCVSIALEFEGRLVVGVIHDPISASIYSARLGGGTRHNGRPVRVSMTSKLNASLISAGLPTQFSKDADRQLAYFRAFSSETHSVRRTGSTALNLALVARGGFDAYYTTSVHPWDVAAGILLVTEAGGTVSTIDGSEYHLNQPSLLATNSLLHDEAVSRARGAWHP